MQAAREEIRPWYRHFWVWFLIALPLTAVIASFITLWIAVDGADRELPGEFRKLGPVVHEAVPPAPVE